MYTYIKIVEADNGYQRYFYNYSCDEVLEECAGAIRVLDEMGMDLQVYEDYQGEWDDGHPPHTEYFTFSVKHRDEKKAEDRLKSIVVGRPKVSELMEKIPGLEVVVTSKITIAANGESFNEVVSGHISTYSGQLIMSVDIGERNGATYSARTKYHHYEDGVIYTEEAMTSTDKKLSCKWSTTGVGVVTLEQDGGTFNYSGPDAWKIFKHWHHQRYYALMT